MSSTLTATLSQLVTVASQDTIRVSAQLNSRGHTKEIFFSVSAAEDDLSVIGPSPEPFVIGMLWPLMQQGLMRHFHRRTTCDGIAVEGEQAVFAKRIKGGRYF